MPILLPALERNGHLKLQEEICIKVQSMSAATIDRLLRTPRNASRVKKAPSGRYSSEAEYRVRIATYEDYPSNVQYKLKDGVTVGDVGVAVLIPDLRELRH